MCTAISLFLPGKLDGGPFLKGGCKRWTWKRVVFIGVGSRWRRWFVAVIRVCVREDFERGGWKLQIEVLGGYMEAKSICVNYY